jgi:putative PIN family toxin of toxin-antitoxin system
MHLVLDTNVVASALLWNGKPRKLLQLGRGGTLKFFTSLPLISELTEILSRKKFEKKISASQLSIDQIIDLYVEFVSVVVPKDVPRIVSDPDDDVVIGTALAAKAALVVSGDAGVLAVKEYEGVRILSVHNALEECCTIKA